MNRTEPSNPNVCLVCDPAVMESAGGDLEGPGDPGEMAGVSAGVAVPPWEAVGARS